MTRSSIMLAAIAATALTIVAAAPASAKIVDVTYTGTVSFGFDATGLFGTVNADLAGKSFTANYRFDDAKGTYAAADQSYGYGAGSPSLGATLTIDDHVASIAGSYYGEIFTSSAATLSEEYHRAEDKSSNGSWSKVTSIYNYTYSSDNALPGQTSTPFNGIGQNSIGYFYAEDLNSEDNTYSTYAYASLLPTNLSITEAVPEPTTWLMMIVGFGAVGGAMRAARRRSAGTVALV